MKTHAAWLVAALLEMREMNETCGQAQSNSFIGEGLVAMKNEEAERWNAMTVADMLREEEQRLHARLGEIEAVRTKLGPSVLKLTRKEFRLLGHIL